MQIGVIGLGLMGGNMTRRLMKARHHCVVFGADRRRTPLVKKYSQRCASASAGMSRVKSRSTPNQSMRIRRVVR